MSTSIVVCFIFAGGTSAGPRERRRLTSWTVTGPNAVPIGIVAANIGGPTFPDPLNGAGLALAPRDASSTNPRELEYPIIRLNGKRNGDFPNISPVKLS